MWFMLKFPANFLWGAATSAYQVEGDNSNCDWWEWEKNTGFKQPSANACRHYELYPEDFDLVKQLHHNAHRLSIEWSRVEPDKGDFSAEEIFHYQKVILALKERNITPIVTLHHFTNPLWFVQIGSWQAKSKGNYFLEYVEQIVDALSENVTYWVTFNEPLVYLYYSYILGDWPPQEKSIFTAKKVIDNIISTHVKAYKIIHDIYRRKNLPRPYVSIAKNTQAFMPCIPSPGNKLAAFLRDRFYNLELISILKRKKSLDYIGINYYSRGLVELNGWGLDHLFMDTCQKNHSRLKKNSMGWDIYPQGLLDVLLEFKKFGLPLFILENGICTPDDNLRWDYIREHLQKVHLAMKQGIDVLGYLYWSLLDNFEWDKGFTPRFGLIDVDYNTYKRTIRKSAVNYGEVCRTGILEE